MVLRLQAASRGVLPATILTFSPFRSPEWFHILSITEEGALSPKPESHFASWAPKQPFLEPKPHKALCKNRIFSLCLGPLYSED